MIKNKVNFLVFLFAVITFTSAAVTTEPAYAGPLNNDGQLAMANETIGSKEEIDEIKLLAKNGNPLSQAKLGLMYLSGNGLIKDEEQAFHWTEKAASQGYTEAQFTLGSMYLNGIGGTQDDKKALDWYQKSANQGFAEAQNSLGWMYAEARGVLQDNKQAIYWYQKSAGQDYAKAQTNIGDMYFSGLGVDQSYEQAFKWYQKSASQGEVIAQFNLSVMYSKGQGVAQDPKKAFYWTEQSAIQGVASAQHNVVLNYLRGSGANKDELKAYIWAYIYSGNGGVGGVDLKNTAKINLSQSEVLRAESLAKECLITKFNRCYLKEVKEVKEVKGPEVTDDEVRRAYRIYVETLIGEGKEYDVRHIMMKDHQEAITALKRVQSGESFAKVAYTTSIDPRSKYDGGALGWLLPNHVTPGFSQAMVALSPKGLTAKPVETRFGWHIIELKAVRHAIPPSFDQVKEELKDELRQLKARQNAN